MNTGLLWFDNNPHHNLSMKVEQAVSYYQRIYGRKPDLCYIHPSELKQTVMQYSEIEIHSNWGVLPNHLWLGIHSIK